ncbi:hypothetical protein WA556_003323 [Blastocystis sp. ATCC 50177/Nand II]
MRCSCCYAFSEMDVLYTMSSLKHVASDPSYSPLLLPLTSAVNQWCIRNVDHLSPHLVCYLLLAYPQMHQSTKVVMQLFATRFQKDVAFFPVSDQVVLLKAFALMRFNNENLVSFLYSRVAEQVKTLQTQELLSVMWTIVSWRKSEVELYAAIRNELEGRKMTKKQITNYKQIVDLYISNS